MLRSLPAPWSLIPPADPPSPPQQALQERRARCETQNIDPVVWTNQRVLKWVRDIDLKVRGDGGAGGDSWANPTHVCVCANQSPFSRGPRHRRPGWQE